MALDDDDLVFANWVQVFHQAAAETPGAVLHSYSVAQTWSQLERKDRTLLAATSNFNSIFAHDFNWASQFQVNRCPLMTNAFPRDAFQRFPFRFDEKLNTVEDWDYLMHVASLVGITSLDSVTAIYRLWSNAENSSSLHTEEEWADNLHYVQKKLRQVPVLLPPGALIPDTDPTDEQKADIELFGMKNGQYSTALKRNPDQVELKNNKWYLSFTKLSSLHLRGQVRLDPSNTGHYRLRQLHITAKMTNGNQQEYTLRNVGSNGLRGKEHLLFLCDDPQLYIRLPEGELAELHVVYQLAWGVSVKDVAKHFLPLTGAGGGFRRARPGPCAAAQAAAPGKRRTVTHKKTRTVRLRPSTCLGGRFFACVETLQGVQLLQDFVEPLQLLLGIVLQNDLALPGVAGKGGAHAQGFPDAALQLLEFRGQGTGVFHLVGCLAVALRLPAQGSQLLQLAHAVSLGQGFPGPGPPCPPPGPGPPAPGRDRRSAGPPGPFAPLPWAG